MAKQPQRRAERRATIETKWGTVTMTEFADGVTIYFPKGSGPDLMWLFPGGPNPNVGFRLSEATVAEEAS